MIDRNGKGRSNRVENEHCQAWDNLRENMKSLRVSKNLTQADLGERMGRGRVFVTELENGRYCPTLALVQLVADALETEPAVLISSPVNSTSKKVLRKKCCEPCGYVVNPLPYSALEISHRRMQR